MELPEGCIAAILCRTTPVDDARLAVVSKTFHSAADSDAVWNHFLPSDFDSIVPQSPSLIALDPSKKSLYLALSDHPVIIDDGKKSFQLDRKSGKKSFMLSARSLSIDRADDKNDWEWIKLPESRFGEVAKLSSGWCLDFHGLLDTNVLSHNTQYAAFLVFGMFGAAGFQSLPMRLSVSISDGHTSVKNVCLDSSLDWAWPHYPAVDGLPLPTVRGDGWLEIEMGDFFNQGLEDKLLMSVYDMYGGNLKSGLHIEGIEVRPRN